MASPLLLPKSARKRGLDSFSEVVQSRVARTLIPTFSQREKEEEREAIRRLNTAIPEEAREELLRKVLRVATSSLVQTNRAFHRMLRDTLLPKLLSGE